MDHDPSALRAMRKIAREAEDSRTVYPEAIVILVLWMVSMAEAAKALSHLLG